MAAVLPADVGVGVGDTNAGEISAVDVADVNNLR